jgi:hypothetical protein
MEQAYHALLERVSDLENSWLFRTF